MGEVADAGPVHQPQSGALRLAGIAGRRTGSVDEVLELLVRLVEQVAVEHGDAHGTDDGERDCDERERDGDELDPQRNPGGEPCHGPPRAYGETMHPVPA